MAERLPEALEQLLEHEVGYFAFAAEAERCEHAWYLRCDALPEYEDVNRALHLRDDGRGPKAVARAVIDYFQARGRPVVADLDSVAEAQGIGAALRRMGVTPTMGNRMLMSYPFLTPPVISAPGVEVREIASGDAAGLRVWIETNLNQALVSADPDYWRYTEWEARYPLCRLYLGLLDGQPAGTCDLFADAGWGRIEMVETLPAWRRRGVASTVVAHAIAASLAQGHSETYLYTDAGGEGERLYLRLGFVRQGINLLKRHRLSL